MNNLELIQSPKAIERFGEILGNERSAKMYVNSVATILRSNNLMQNASRESIYGAVLAAVSMNLDISLGEAYIVPYKGNAAFQIGYKGLIKFAIATNMVKKLNACPIYTGQISEYNALEGNKYDFSVAPSGEPIGYAALLELHNGYTNSWYMSTDAVKKYGKKYSQSYESKFSPWQTAFDEMACKTVLKKLSPYIPKTTNYAYDNSVIIATPDTKSFEDAEVQFETFEVASVDDLQEFEAADFFKATEILKKVKFSEDMTEAVMAKFSEAVNGCKSQADLQRFFSVTLNGEMVKILNNKKASFNG